VLVRGPDQLGVERAHPQLAFGLRLVELAAPDRHFSAGDHRTLATLMRLETIGPAAAAEPLVLV
jgi:hypothetical protein